MMVGMTAKAKVAVSLPGELLEAVKAAVAAGHAPNVSAYVADALPCPHASSWRRTAVATS